MNQVLAVGVKVSSLLNLSIASLAVTLLVPQIEEDHISFKIQPVMAGTRTTTTIKNFVQTRLSFDYRGNSHMKTFCASLMEKNKI